MSVTATVVSNTPRSDGTIVTEIEAWAPTGSAARLKAKNRALFHNGYSKAFTRESNGVIGISVKETERVEDGKFRDKFRVVTEISGAERF